MKILPKLALAFVALLTLIFVGVAVLSVAIDDAQIKASVLSYVNSHFKGKLDIDKAQLKLLSGPSLRLTGVQFNPGADQDALTPNLSIDSVDVSLNWRDVLQRNLFLDLEARGSQVVFKSKTSAAATAAVPNAQTNTAAPDPAAVATAVTQNAETLKRGTELSIGWFADIKVKNAKLLATQIFLEREGAKTKLGQFDLELFELGLAKNVEFKLNGNVTYDATTTSATGDINVEGKFIFRDGNVEPLVFHADLSKLGIKGTTFQKPKDVAADLKGSASYVNRTLKLDAVTLTLPNAVATLEANVTNTELLDGSGVAKFDVADLKVFEQLFIEPRTVESGGSLKVESPFSFVGGKLAKAEVTFVEKVVDFDLHVKADVSDAETPKADFTITSEKFDARRLVLPFVAQKHADRPWFKLTGGKLRSTANLNGQMLHISELKMDTFGGGFSATADLNHAGDRELKFQAKVVQAELQRITEFFSIAENQKVFGRADLQVDFFARTLDAEKFKSSALVEGKFKIVNASFDATQVSQSIEKEVSGALSELPKSVISSKAFSDAEKLMNQPGVRELARKSNFDLEKIKSRFDSMREMKFFSQGNNPDLKPIEGKFSVTPGETLFDLKRTSRDGVIKVSGQIARDLGLKGTGDFTASAELKESLVKKSEYAKLLFAPGGVLQLSFALNGSLDRPSVAFDFEKLRTTFQTNANELTDDEINAETKRLSDQLAKRLQGSKLGQEIEKAIGNDPETGQPQKVEDLVKKAIEKNRERLKKYLKQN